MVLDVEVMQGLLSKRQNDNSEYCDIYGCYSTWDNWGRWVALVVIIVCILILAFLCTCYSSRRRRRRGQAPMYGTGWLPYNNYPYNHAGTNKRAGNAAPGYYANDYHPPPPYVGNQATGNTFNTNEGYYGHHNGVQPQNEFELQQPSSSYQPRRGTGGDDVYDAPEAYEAPVGPPPKGSTYNYNSPDGVVR